MINNLRWIKKLYISKVINRELFDQLERFSQSENISLIQIDVPSLEIILRTTNKFTLNIVLLSDTDITSNNCKLFFERLNQNYPILIISVCKNENQIESIKQFNFYDKLFYTFLLSSKNSYNLNLVISNGFKYLQTSQEKIVLEEALKQRSKEIIELTNIGKALATEKDYSRLLNYILEKGKELTNSDAGSLYLIEDDEHLGKCLSFKISDLILNEMEKKFSLSKKSISGHVALTGKILNIDDAYNLSGQVDYTLNLDYDRKYNYRTKSMLVVPMVNQKDEIIGVLQLINKKRNNKKITVDNIKNEVISYNRNDVELAVSLAGQAAVAIQSSQLQKRSKEITDLTNIGKALATERNHHNLLRFILEKSKEITNCDAGSIYLVKKDENGIKYLSFRTSDLELHDKEFTFPIDKSSISGYVALTKDTLNIKDAYHLPEHSEYKLNLEYDKKHNYRTKSMLVVPMTNQKSEVIGILQLINKKKDKDTILTSIESIEKEIISFNEHDIELVASIAGQAAVAIENNFLYQEIERLFEGFVRASVKAIESRDPTTSGHSERVAIYTVELAKAVDKYDEGKWKNVKFSRDQIKEIRYASLLHDFGKVGVRERVLVKSQKLYPEEFELIKNRFNFIKRTLQYESSERKIKYLLDKNKDEALSLMKSDDEHLINDFEEIDTILRLIAEADLPKVLEGDINNAILEIANKTYKDIDNKIIPFLNEKEVKALSIRKGSLGELERLEIESHVTHTFEFLSQIPWTSELMNIPEIAYAHHEKLNGDGYPRKINETIIPIQSRLMTISDIYDALVASDRPYKKSISASKALDILQLEVKDNHVDPELVKLFIDAKIYLAAQQ
ncbi:MAG: GAF domain-containing protein [Spirochaetota bacterium]|nr:GAF domain-containing protein [Spirochaetota bacterium]